jgi:hypothetical protein
MNRGKEVVLELHKNYNVVSGTVDNKNPRSIYIQISTWGLPKKTNINYDNVFRVKTGRVKRRLNEIINDSEFYKNKCIVDFNMASSGITEGKKSYMSVEMTLFKKPPLSPINSDKIKPILNKISEEIINLFENDEDFNFFKKKGD